jgi:biotin-(acetyl-CoA carboxylase) ligase
MREKIIKEALEWYEKQEKNPDIEDFVDLVIDKTADNMLEHIQKEFEDEFKNGILEHPYFISSEYYLELKLKDVKNKFIQDITKDVQTVKKES